MGAATAIGAGAAVVGAGSALHNATKGGQGGATSVPDPRGYIFDNMPAVDPNTGEQMIDAEGNPVFTENPLGIGGADPLTGRMAAGYTSDQQRERDYFANVQRQAELGGSPQERAMAQFGMGAGARDIGGAYGAAQGLGMDAASMAEYARANRDSAFLQSVVGQRQGDIGAGQVQQGVDLQGFGRGQLGTDYGAVRDERLGLLRQQAAPYEERAQNTLAQKLFSMGQLGTEGGARNIEAFGEGLGRADLQRQLQSQDIANALRQQDRALGMQAVGAGANMAQMGAGMIGQQGAAQMASADLGGRLFGAQQQFRQGQMSRAQQRLQGAQDIFGFGTGLRDRGFDRFAAAQSGRQAVTEEMRMGHQLASNVMNASTGQISSSGRTGPDALSAGLGALAGAGQTVAQNWDQWTGGGGQSPNISINTGSQGLNNSGFGMSQPGGSYFNTAQDAFTIRGA